jgi:transketolase
MIIEKKTIRDAFIEQIYHRMHEDSDIFFLTADFGSPVLDRLKEKFRNRFINVSIAMVHRMLAVSRGI